MFDALPTANENASEPVHRWFHYKESFSYRLLDVVLRFFPQNSQIRFLDPFCGVGTSLVAAQTSNLSTLFSKVVGIERNPFIHFVSRTKSRWMYYDVEDFSKTWRRAVAWDLKPFVGELPALSTIRDPRVFTDNTVRMILSYREAIKERIGSINCRDLMLLGLAAAIETVSGVRKDGRALRFKESKKHNGLGQELTTIYSQFEEDLRFLQRKQVSTPPTTVACGDGRFGSKMFGREKFDLILYSPPYLNNIDYSEVYKLELWLLGFIKSSEDFRKLRLSTFKSHPSCKFPMRGSLTAITNGEYTKLISPLKSFWSLQQDKLRARIVEGYCEDVLDSLRDQRKLLSEDGRITIIVGNSVYGGPGSECVIATDLLICALAEEVGLTVDSLYKCRTLQRRRIENPSLRESVIVLRLGK